MRANRGTAYDLVKEANGVEKKRGSHCFRGKVMSWFKCRETKDLCE